MAGKIIPFSEVFECNEKNLQSFLVLLTTWNVKYHRENIQYYYLNIICFTSKFFYVQILTGKGIDFQK